MVFPDDRAPLLFDGAMASLLVEKGLLDAGESPEFLNISRPLDVLDLHMAYKNAGARILSSNTSGILRLAASDSCAPIMDMMQSGVALCREAALSGGERAYVAAALGPVGAPRDPEGAKRVHQAARTIAAAAADAGADLLLIETMNDLFEARLLLLGARAASSLPVLVSFTLEPDDFTFSGNSPAAIALCCARLGAAMVGINCDGAPAELFSGFSALMGASSIPVFARPDARSRAGTILPPADFAKAMLPYLQSGAHAVGGCCGTGPAHIEALAALLPEARGCARPPKPVEGYLSGPRRRVPLDVIEETKPLLLSGMAPEPCSAAISEAAEGAQALALDLGALSPEEVQALLLQSLPALQHTTLAFHVYSAAQAEAALFLYPGIAAIRAERDAYRVLKVAARYGAEVLA